MNTIITLVAALAAFGLGFWLGWAFRSRAHRKALRQHAAELTALDVERRAWVDLALEVDAKNFVYRGMFDGAIRDTLVQERSELPDSEPTPPSSKRTIGALLVLLAALLPLEARADEPGPACSPNVPCVFSCKVTETWTHPVVGKRTVTSSTEVEAPNASHYAEAKKAFLRDAKLYEMAFRAASKRYDACSSRESPCSAEAFIDSLEAYTSWIANRNCAAQVKP